MISDVVWNVELGLSQKEFLIHAHVAGVKEPGIPCLILNAERTGDAFISQLILMTGIFLRLFPKP